MNKKLLILGCGYSGQFISKQLTAEGWRVFGTTRSKEHFKKFEESEIEPILWNDISAFKYLATNGCALLSSIAPRG